MWDYRTAKNGLDLKELVLKSSKGELPKQIEQQLIEEMKLAPEMALEWNPESIPCLAEKHTNLALEILSAISKNSRAAEYFQELYKVKLNARHANFVVKLNDRTGGLNVPMLFNYIKSNIDDCIAATSVPEVKCFLSPCYRKIRRRKVGRRSWRVLSRE